MGQVLVLELISPEVKDSRGSIKIGDSGFEPSVGSSATYPIHLILFQEYYVIK